MKQCSVCEETKESHQFNKKSASKDGLRPECKECRKYQRIRYRPVTRFYMRQYTRRKRSTDPVFRLAELLRGRINKAIDGDIRPGSAVRDLGCTPAELRAHLETQFYPRSDGLEMAWGQRGLWEVHHIRPLASFDLSDRAQFKQACHYSNLTPVWKEDHQSIHSQNWSIKQ
jgi:hypothetical protein